VNVGNYTQAVEVEECNPNRYIITHFLIPRVRVVSIDMLSIIDAVKYIISYLSQPLAIFPVGAASHFSIVVCVL
jgi:hypothetical protein